MRRNNIPPVLEGIIQKPSLGKDYSLRLQLGELPKDTLAYFAEEYLTSHDQVLSQKKRETLVDLIIRKGKADITLYLYREAEEFIEAHKDHYFYFYLPSGKRYWRQVSLSRVQYQLDNSQQFGGALFYTLLHTGETMTQEGRFKAIRKKDILYSD